MRRVFYINLPIGIGTLMGMWTFLPDTEKDPGRRFDGFGFVMLSLAFGSLQLLLDRGQGSDCLSCTDILLECLIAGLTFYLFVVLLVIPTLLLLRTPASIIPKPS